MDVLWIEPNIFNLSNEIGEYAEYTFRLLWAVRVVLFFAIP